MTAKTHRKLYDEGQIDQYFKRVKLPAQHQKQSISSLTDEQALEYLSVLQKYHLAAVPFENLSLHYSQYRQISIHPDALFKKIVLSEGRGGYCMEQNELFATVLQTLGFRLYSAGARVAAGRPAFSGWSHMCNIVTIGDRKYMVDVGFGPSGPFQPLFLDRNNSPILPNIRPASQRLVYKALDLHTDPDQRVWAYQWRPNDDVDWQDYYTFVELEFFPQDYDVMNYYTSTHPKVWFTHQVMCAKRIMGDAGDLTGIKILSRDSLKWFIEGTPDERQDFKSEEERLEALEKHFDIRFDPDEVVGIKGMVSAVRG